MTKPVSRKSKWLAGLILVTIVALLIGGGCVANSPPIISSLVLTTEGEITPGMTAQIECTASDADEDTLSYSWTADGGALSGFGGNAAWTAPDEVGTYTVTIEVSDGEAIVTDQLTITVLAPNTPPVIESLTTDCPRVRPGHSGTITCEALDPDGDELTYTWSAERGAISGSEAEVTWTAPNEYGTFVITVIVTDGRGDEVGDGIQIIVCACGSAC